MTALVLITSLLIGNDGFLYEKRGFLTDQNNAQQQVEPAPNTSSRTCYSVAPRPSPNCAYVCINGDWVEACKD
jgi:hypothetical protein